jgi:hypothetical protein
MKNPIIVVSGLPRSGTSMLTQMLHAGGLPVVTDSVRIPDEHNPRGYFEDERVKDLEHDASWLFETRGKAVKIVSPLLKYLPENLDCVVLFMRRDLAEVMASQSRMLESLESPPKEGPHDLATLLRAHLRETEQWMKDRRGTAGLFINHDEVLRHPKRQAEMIRDFLVGLGLDVSLDVEAMAAAVDPALRRQRAEELDGEPQQTVVRLPASLYAKLAAAARSAGFDNANDFAVLLLEQTLEEQPPGQAASTSEDQAIRDRLQSLGYL